SPKPTLDIFKDIQRIGAFGQDIALQPEQPDIDFTATIETMKLPSETMNKGIQQIGEGDALTGALNVGLGIAHTMFLPFSLPFAATTDVLRSGGRVAGIEDVTESAARVFEIPFEIPGRLVEEGQRQIDAGLQSLGVDTKQTDQAIVGELIRRGLVKPNASPEELANTMTEINKLGATILTLKAAHIGYRKTVGKKVTTKDVERLKAPKIDIKGEAIELQKMLAKEKVVPKGFERVKPLAEKQLEPKFKEVKPLKGKLTKKEVVKKKKRNVKANHLKQSQ
ncbi:unnamed protein product, partial [marine sediment metagenome]